MAGAEGFASGFLAVCLAGGLEAGFATGLAFLAGAFFAGVFAGGVERAGFFGKAFAGLAGAFLTRVGAGFAFAGIFFGATFFAGTLADGLAALAGRAVFLAGAFTLGFEAATGFLATGFADFFGRGLPSLELDFTVGLEGFETFFAALD